jgi:hypothetical protein
MTCVDAARVYRVPVESVKRFRRTLPPRTAEVGRAPESEPTPATLDPIPRAMTIESAQDVIADLQRLRNEAFDLFEGAKARKDWQRAQQLFTQLVAIIDRFGEMHKV